MRRKASPLFVQGIAQAIAIHLARNYAVTVKKSHSGSPSLPAYKLRQITDWMTAHVVENFALARLAALVGLSKYHFHRQFKSAIGVSPSRYHTNLRMELARRLLRETKKSVVAVALEVGYSNLTDKQVEHIVATNLVGSIQLIRAALPHLRTQGGGRIIQISSYGGQVAFSRETRCTTPRSGASRASWSQSPRRSHPSGSA